LELNYGPLLIPPPSKVCPALRLHWALRPSQKLPCHTVLSRLITFSSCFGWAFVYTVAKASQPQGHQLYHTLGCTSGFRSRLIPPCVVAGRAILTSSCACSSNRLRVGKFFRASLIFLNAAVIPFLNSPRTWTAYIQHPHGRDVLFVRGTHPLHPLRKGHAMARAHVYLSSFLSAVFISLKHLLPLTGGSCGLKVTPLFFSYVPWAAPPNCLPVFYYGKHLRSSHL
jgi:hypothetical protein